ncbi:8379_t:CDS:1, partial [Acaulospora morrowiae]
MKIHPVFYVSLLKPYKTPFQEFNRPIPPSAIILPNTEQEEYE